MNKLAPLALILLLAFGGALWYLANGEFNASIQARIIKVGNYYTDQQVSVERVNIELSQGVGEIAGITLKQLPSSGKSTLLNIGHIHFSFQINTLNSTVIIIDELIMTDAEFYLTSDSVNDNGDTNFEALYQLINDKIALIQDSRKQKAEAYLQVNQIKIINPQIFLNNQHLTTPESFLLAPIGSNNGLPASLFGTEILRKTIETVSEFNSSLPK